MHSTTAPSSRPELARILSANGLIRWPLPEALAASPEVVYRNRFAEKLANRDIREILGAYVYYTMEEMDRLLSMAERHVLREPLQGVGIELGAGTGLLSSLVARWSGVRAVLALEVCEGVARQITPKVARAVLDEEASKVVPVVGSFDDLCLADASLDFAVEIGSLHHSSDLPRTMAEVARVLKPGGTVLCFDRCHPDTLTDEQVEKMLDETYSREFLEGNGYPPERTLTRRENGEHEYRRFEWEAAFAGAGLVLERLVEFREPLKFRHAVRGLLQPLRGKRRDRFGRKKPFGPGTARDYLRQRWCLLRGRERCGNDVLAPRRTTAMALRKTLSSSHLTAP